MTGFTNHDQHPPDPRLKRIQAFLEKLKKEEEE